MPETCAAVFDKLTALTRMWKALITGAGTAIAMQLDLSRKMRDPVCSQ